MVPLVTPFDADGSVDRAGLKQLVAWHLARGVEALMPTALSGEALLLDERETRLVWETVCAEIDGHDVAFLPAIITLTTRRARRLASLAHDLGAAAVLAAPALPELYAGRAVDELVAFYREVAAASDVPIIVFDYPPIIGLELDARVLERLLTVESVAFLKTSSADPARRLEQIKEFGERIGVLCGAPCSVLDCLSLGSRGWITGILNIVPEIGLELIDCFHAGAFDRVRRSFFEVIVPFAELIRTTRKPVGVLKGGLSARGVPVGAPRPPGLPLTEGTQLGRLVQSIETSGR